MVSHLHIFDLDGTLLWGTSSFRFFFYLIFKRRLPVSSLFQAIPLFCAYRLRRLSLSQLHERVFNLFLKGRPQSLFLDAVEPFLNRCLDRMMHLPVVSTMKSLPFTILLSSSPDFLVGPIAGRLGIHHWKGTEYGVDKENIFCKISTLIEGREKLRFARDFAERLSIPAQQITAYSDSDDDLPLLEWVGTPYAVRPNKGLRKVAREKGWKII